MQDAINKMIGLAITLGATHELPTDLEEMVEWVNRWSQADDDAFHAVDRVGDEIEFDADSGVAETSEVLE